MTQAELYSALIRTGFPVTYHHFSKPQIPPFIVFIWTSSDDFMADDINYQSISNYQVELYTTSKDQTSEKKLEDILKENKLPYTKLEVWIDSEKLYQIVYVIQI